MEKCGQKPKNCGLNLKQHFGNALLGVVYAVVDSSSNNKRNGTGLMLENAEGVIIEVS